MMENKVLLQADIGSIIEKTKICEPPSIKKQTYTLANWPEPNFAEIKELMSEKPLHFIERPPLST